MKIVMKEYIIKKEIKYCPICEEEHEITLKKINQVNMIKGCEVECDNFIYICESSGVEYEDGELADKNLLSLRDAYRKKNNLLTRDEIVAIRNKYKISQEDLSNILGLGEKTIARYETSTIQDKPYDVLLRKFNDDYNFAYDMLMKAEEKFEEKKFAKIKDVIAEYISENSENIYNEMKLKNRYINVNSENSSNGYVELNVEKVKGMVAYFAKFTNNLFLVKLMKLLWYSDALSYIRSGKAMSGLIYTHMPMGALPIGFKEIGELDSVDKQGELICDNICYRFVPKNIDRRDETLFSNEELIILAEVCEKFKDLSGTELSEIMHKEDVYLVTKENQILDFSLIRELKGI